jgi:hypothetical protein
MRGAIDFDEVAEPEILDTSRVEREQSRASRCSWSVLSKLVRAASSTTVNRARSEWRRICPWQRLRLQPKIVFPTM